MKLQLENQLIDPRDEICDQLNSLLMLYLTPRLELFNKLDDYLMNSSMGDNNANDSGMVIYFYLRDQLDK